MEIKINIPKDFTGDYIADKFKDFFSRVIADIDNNGLCGNYEKEIAEMFIKAFDESIEANNTCNCQHNNNPRDNEPCCRCDSRKTNSDRIRNMPDEELAEFIQKIKNTCLVDFMGYADKDCEQDRISCKDCEAKAPTIFEWLQSEAE